MASSTSAHTSEARDKHGNPAGLHEQSADVFDDTVTLRRRLHEWPELGLDLPKTRDAVLEQLEGLGLDITLHETTSGIGALLTGGKPGPTVLIRGDMDALPLHEDTPVEFTSRNDETMHACGHDLHTAMLVGAAKVLAARRADIPGRVLFMFQPGEEGHQGAAHMIDEGVLEVPNLADGSPSPITGAYAIHVTSNLPNGFIASKGGPIMASSDSMTITVKGRGGHGSSPHFALDPIPVACEIVGAIQHMVSRKVNAFDPGVVSVTAIHSGTTFNVIPETAEIKGTIRAVSEPTRTLIHDNLKRVVEGIATAHGAEATIDIFDGYPVTSNDADGAAFATSIADAVVGRDHVIRMTNPVMGAEDFSYVLNKIPGAMVFLGACPEGLNPFEAPGNHSNRVFFNEDAMKAGVAMYSAMALRHLRVELS